MRARRHLLVVVAAQLVDVPDRQPAVGQRGIATLSPAILNNKVLGQALGVDVEIGNNYSILDTGGWVQEETDDKPNLIAIHRFGLDTLSPQEKIRTTLYHVYTLNKGDQIILWWNGQEYIYEVQGVYEDTRKPEIKEDELYLYTCLFWDSETRVFVKLI